MRILHLANHCRDSGNGIVNVMVDLACVQAADGHDVAVASAGGGFVELLERHGVRHHALTGGAPRRLGRLPRLLRAVRPDVVHAHMREGAVAARLLQPFGTYRLVTTVHNVGEPRSRLMGVGERVVAVSRRSVAVLTGWGIPESRIRVVLNGPLGGPRAAPDDESVPDLPPGGRVLMTVAGLYRHKGVAELIDAFDAVAGRFADVRLVVVGEGPDRAALEARAAAARHAERIRFVGFQRRPRRWLERADLFVLASHRDTCPLVVAEARAAGCAVVATDVDGIPETLDGGAAGILVPPRDPAALAAALEGLLADPSTLAEARAAARRGLEHHHVRRAADEVMAVYAELVPAAAALATSPR